MIHNLRKAKNESYLNKLLEGKDTDFQRRVVAVAVEHGLSTSDPLFLIMLSTGQLQVLLEDKPSELNQLFQRWSEAIYEHLEKAKRTVISGQEVEIRSMVNRLIKHCESTASFSESGIVSRVAVANSFTCLKMKVRLAELNAFGVTPFYLRHNRITNALILGVTFLSFQYRAVRLVNDD